VREQEICYFPSKIERWHRTVRDQFLSELDAARIGDLADLNARLWAWLECVYHRTPHEALAGQTPLARYQQDLRRSPCPTPSSWQRANCTVTWSSPGRPPATRIPG
jgi:hypothetical protein